MSSFFDQELWHLFGDGKIIDNPACAGRTCFGTLGKDLRVRIQFVSTHIAGEYDALKLTVLNRTDGPVDTQMLWLKDLLGKKPVPGNPNFRSGVVPHIWDDYGKFEWYAYRPTAADYETIRQAAGQYLNVFRERQQERAQDGPKLVYICAPLRGDVEKNIEFARRKAQEVFQAGDIPVCPHLMFPPIADPENPVQDQAAREMACGWWNPVRRSTSTARSGRRECGRRSATPWIWALRSRPTRRPLGAARPAGRLHGKARVKDEQ